MRLFRLLVASLCLAVLGTATAPAHAAGTVTVSPILWQNRNSANLMTTVLNRNDCLRDLKGTATVAIRGTGTSGLNFELWAGNNCDQLANRNAGSVTRTCSKVMNVGNPVDQTITVAFRDLIKAFGDDTPATDAVCNLPQNTGLISRTLYFLVLDSSLATAAAGTPWNFKFDIVAPIPPVNVTATPGDETLVTSFKASTTESNLLKYHFYCSPKSATPAATGGTTGTDTGGTDTGGTDTTGTETGGASETAGTGGTSGTSGSSGSAGTGFTPDPDCNSDILVPGQPVPDGAIECGDVPATGATGGETDPVLTNDDQFAVAVATEDSVNNIGVLSNLACGTPKDVRGFYENYRDAGGEAGGGYCSFAPAKHGPFAVLLGLGLAAFAVRRRRR
jgi:hypothetical protein